MFVVMTDAPGLPWLHGCDMFLCFLCLIIYMASALCVCLIVFVCVCCDCLLAFSDMCCMLCDVFFCLTAWCCCVCHCVCWLIVWVWLMLCVCCSVTLLMLLCFCAVVCFDVSVLLFAFVLTFACVACGACWDVVFFVCWPGAGVMLMLVCVVISDFLCCMLQDVLIWYYMCDVVLIVWHCVLYCCEAMCCLLFALFCFTGGHLCWLCFAFVLWSDLDDMNDLCAMDVWWLCVLCALACHLCVICDVTVFACLYWMSCVMCVAVLANSQCVLLLVCGMTVNAWCLLMHVCCCEC